MRMASSCSCLIYRSRAHSVRLACFRARIEFDRGNSKGAVDDALAALTLARQAGKEPILFATLSNGPSKPT